MNLTSSAFAAGADIPQKYACDGDNLSPPLEISGVSEGAKSLTLIMHDGDAPVVGGWTHWVVFNMDPSLDMIGENSAPESGIQATTSAGKNEYSGPCPPSGTHHYEFRLYALDEMLPLQKEATKADVEKSMEGHIVEQTTLVGLYTQE